MRIGLLFFSFLICFPAFCQPLSMFSELCEDTCNCNFSVKYKQSGGDKFKGSIQNCNKTGTWVFRRPNGSLKESMNFRDGVLNGEYKSDFQNGKPNQRGMYENGIRVGVWKESDKYERFQIEGRYDDQQNRDGEWVSHYIEHPNQIESIIYYEHGERTGTWKHWHQNGELKSLKSFLNGKPFGPCLRYYENGNLRDSIYYNEDGKVHGEKKWYRKNGVIAGSVTFVNGEVMGESKSYRRNGQLEARGKKNGYSRVGKWEIYHENGQISSTGNYENERQVGIWEFYDQNGKLIRTKNMDEIKEK